MCCKTCPFALTDESEQVQNYGCLPSALDIIKMKKETGANWACHNTNQEIGLKICKGLIKYNNHYKLGLIIHKNQPKIPYELWYINDNIQNAIVK